MPPKRPVALWIWQNEEGKMSADANEKNEVLKQLDSGMSCWPLLAATWAQRIQCGELNDAKDLKHALASRISDIKSDKPQRG
ncbi:hypothetical protein Hamer_G002100 [Homarus americanus]|uniref:Uncharacterized protein n=1 Tax=Homarus americanus TaxID=6706 RepID=A0A8J5MTQ8_HOMAM|nr:hypothetical protein Hamer_G002100 [Homarus americanus]